VSVPASFNVTVQDTTAPVIQPALDINDVEASGSGGAVVTYTPPTATDLVSGNVAVNCSPASGSTFGLGTTAVNCSATDAAGNTANSSFNVTVQDTTGPTLALPGNITAEATSASGATVSYSASAEDVVDGSVAVNCSPASGSTFGLGTTAVNCSATDAAGNTGSASFNVTVQDTTPPALTVPANIMTEATGPSGATVTYSASALDAVDAAPLVSCSPASGSTFGIEVTTVSCTATDNSGNTSAPQSFTVTVQDTTPPVVEPHDNITNQEAAGPAGASVIFFSPNANDIVDGLLATACSPASGSTFPLGTTTVTCSVTDEHGNSASGTFTVEVVDTTAPGITDLGPTSSPDGNNGWYKSAVTNQFRASDLVGFTGHPNPYDFTQSSGTAQGTAVAIASGPVTDAHSNTNPGINSAAFKIDLTVPTLTGGATTSPNAAGWYKNDVTVHWTAADALSGIDPATQPADSTITGEGANLSASVSVSDMAGNTNSASVSGIKIDHTAPTVTGAATTGPNGFGWYNGNVTIHWTGTDGLSGIDTSTQPADSTITGEGSNLGAGPVSISDLAGNAGSGSVSGIKIDRTAPTVSLVGGPANGANYYFGSVPAAPTCSASDALSGLDGSCSTPSGHSIAVGAHTITTTATDKAGNVSSASVTYTVLAWTIRGFYQPVDMGGAVNVAKAGSTVPLKFEVFAGNTELTDTSFILGLRQQQVNCSGGVLDDIEAYATGGTSLRYDTTAGQFIFNWQTPRSAGTCYVVTVTTSDGSTISANFKLR
jgi:hypothetical protein